MVSVLLGGCMLIPVWESMGSLLPFRFLGFKERRKASKDIPPMLWIAFFFLSFGTTLSPLLGRSSRSFVRLAESLYLSSPRLTLRHNLYRVLLTDRKSVV